MNFTAKVHQSDGQVATDTYNRTILAWNKGYSMYNAEFRGYGHECNQAARDNFATMNHTPTNGRNTDSKSTIIGTSPNYDGRLRNSSVAYLGTHGNFFAMALISRNWMTAKIAPNYGWMYATAQTADITHAVQAKIAASLPEHFNFVFADAGESACGACFTECTGNHGPGGGLCEQNHLAFDAFSYLGWTRSVPFDRLQSISPSHCGTC